MVTHAFGCKCGAHFEDIVPRTQKTRKCVVCGGRAKRLFPTRFALRTGTHYASTYGTLDRQFNGNAEQLGVITQAAARRGYRPKPSDIYDSGLGPLGHPDNFIPSDDPVGHIKRVCAKRRIGCQGRLDIPTPEAVELPKPPRMSPALVEQYRRFKLRREPDLKHVDQNKLRAEIVEKHGKQE